MDGLSAAASITAVIKIAGTVTQYVAAVKGASKERQKILSEISSVTGMLYLLKDQADDAENDDAWNATSHSLNTPNGPLEQFKMALDTLASKLAPGGGWKKLGKPLMWPFQEKEIKDILSAIERQKALFSLARQNDHM